jgi:DNA-binding MarR family transcriptional regulator
MEDIIEILKSWEEINKRIRRKHRETAQKYGFSFEQFHLLIELDHHSDLTISSDSLPPTIGNIADYTGNAPHTISERIKRLEKRGLITKVRDKNDHRICRVILSPDGQKVIDEIKHEAGNIFLHNALNKMDDKSLKNLLNGLKELNQNLDSLI